MHSQPEINTPCVVKMIDMRPKSILQCLEEHENNKKHPITNIKVEHFFVEENISIFVRHQGDPMIIWCEGNNFVVGKINATCNVMDVERTMLTSKRTSDTLDVIMNHINSYSMYPVSPRLTNIINTP